MLTQETHNALIFGIGAVIVSALLILNILYMMRNWEKKSKKK